MEEFNIHFNSLNMRIKIRFLNLLDQTDDIEIITQNKFKQNKFDINQYKQHTPITTGITTTYYKCVFIPNREVIKSLTPRQTSKRGVTRVTREVTPMDFSILDDEEFMLEGLSFVHANAATKTKNFYKHKVTPPGSDSGRTSDSEPEFLQMNKKELEKAMKDLLAARKALDEANTDTTHDYSGPIVSISKFRVPEKKFEAPVNNTINNEITTIGNIVQTAMTNTTILDFLGSDSLLMASTITSSIVAISASLTTVFSKDLTTTTKVLNAISIVSSLTTFTLAASKVLKRFKDHDTADILAQLPALADTILSVDTTSNSNAWIYPAITAMVSIIIGIMTVFNIADVKTIIEKGRLLQASNGIATASKDVTKFLLEDLAGLDICGDQVAFAELHRWAKRTSELITLPFVDYIQQPTLMKELTDAINVTLPVITNKYSKRDMTHAARTAYQLILQNQHQLFEKQKAIKILMDATKRIEALGVMFAGSRALGKSTLCEYVARRVSEILDLQPGVYNLNKSKEQGFYAPYGGQHFAEINEFMSLKEDDPNLGMMNQIISGDYMNLEAAHLEGKTQPFQARIVFLTANNIGPDITRKLEKGAAEGTWDRILRFVALDPLNEGRQGRNLHRKPDFSHLSFRFVMNGDETISSNLRYKDLNIEEMLGLVLYQTAKREYEFYTRAVLSKKMTQEETESRMAVLRPIVNCEATANSGSEFTVVRLQGSPGTGKSRMAIRIANTIVGSFPAWKVFDIKNFLTPPVARGVYIIDDIIETTKKSYTEYLQWINQGHKHNLYIICTNHIYERRQNRRFYVVPTTKSWILDTHGSASGVCRRLGLDGHVVNSDGSDYTNGDRSITIDQTKKGSYVYKEEEHTQSDLIEHIYNVFLNTIKSSETVTIINETFDRVGEDFDCTIKVKSFEVLNEIFKTPNSMLKARLGMTTNATVVFKTHLISAIMKQFSHREQLLPGLITDRESLLEQAGAIASILNTAVPGISSRLVVEDTHDDIVLHDRLLYIGESLTTSDFHFNHDTRKMMITFRTTDQQYNVSYEAYSHFRNTGIMVAPFEHMDPYMIKLLHNYVEDKIGKTDPQLNYHMWYSSILKAKDDVVNKGITQFIRDRPVLSLITAIIGLTTIGLLTTSVVRLFKKQNVTSNSADDENDLDPRVQMFAARFRKALLKGKAHADSVREEAYTSGLREQFNQWEYDFRSNNMPVVQAQLPLALATGDIVTITRLITKSPAEVTEFLASNKPNMLSTKETQHQSQGELQKLGKKLQKSYVKVITDTGFTFGLMLYDNIGITVGHVISHHQKTFQISSDGQTYEAEVLAIERNRDYLLYKIISKDFPFAPNITSMFANEEEFHNIKTAWYIRPTTEFQAINAPCVFVDRHRYPLTDKLNPFFRVEGKSWMYSLIGMERTKETFLIGDCGFPLVGRINNQWKIIGIHNAFNTTNIGWFASISLGDITQIKSNSTVSPVKTYKQIQHQISHRDMAIDDKMYSAVMSETKESRYENCSKLSVFGYNAELNFHSYPKHKKTYIDVASKNLVCETIGSAVDTTNIKDFSKLIKDKKGEYNPLFSQAVKYRNHKGLFSFDSEIDAFTTQYLKSYYKKHFPETRSAKLHEILNGMEHLRGLEMSTSAGPKFKKFFKVMTKRPQGNEEVLFKDKSNTTKPWYEINTETSAGRELLNDYRFYSSAIEQGNAVLTVVKDNAKIELLPISKVEEGKVRLFNEMDLSINMVLKKYFGVLLDQMIKKHDQTMFCIGMNPYRDATTHMLHFNMREGEFINADFKALDKTIPALLIKDFVETTLPHASKIEREALTETLTYRLHTMNGHLYFIDCGNASGSFVTTMLNCHVVAKVSLYTFVKRWKSEMKCFPSFDDVENNVCLRILGDDAIRKYNQIFSSNITQEELIEDAATYGLEQTPAKTDGLVSFCSREYVHFKGIYYFPQLKRSSITSCLFWFKSLIPSQVHQNCFTALMEAGLHDEEFYNNIVDTVIELSTKFSFPLDVVPHNVVQQCWLAYISGERSSPIWGRSDPDTQYNTELLSNSCKEENKRFVKMADMWLNEYVQRNALDQPEFSYHAEGPEESLLWKAQVNLVQSEKLLTGQGLGYTKSDAKRSACEELKRTVEHPKANNYVVIASCYTHEGRDHHSDNCKDMTLSGLFKSKVKMMRFLKSNHPGVISYKKETIEDLMKTKCVTAIDTAINGYMKQHVLPVLKQELEALKARFDETGEIDFDSITKLDQLEAQFSEFDVKSNMGPTDTVSIEPATMNQAMMAQQASSLPSERNPQPTAMQPAVTAPGDDIMGALQFAQETTLVPIGAPNMLSVGAIGFDLKMLIYEQFIDCDQEFSTTESAPTGSIIFQIPYAVISEFTNAYIQAYARMHQRYTGSIQFRITVIGNQLLSGAIGVCWREQRQTESSMLISETQIVSYGMKAVQNPWNEIHTLHDARQSLFYRNVEDDSLPGALDDRPHLIAFVGMNVYNPYRDNTLVRFRVASKLSNAAEPNPFFFALPSVRTELPTRTSSTVPTAQNFNSMFPQTINNKIHIYTDGTLRKGSDTKVGESYPAYNPKCFNIAGTRTVSNWSRNSRFFSTSSYQLLTGTTNSRFPDIINYWTTSGYFTGYKITVGVISQTTMDAQSFSDLCAASPYQGMAAESRTGGPSQTQWENMRLTTLWNLSSAHSRPSDLKIYSILYNENLFRLSDHTIGTTVDTQRTIVVGYVKVITNHGVAIFYQLSTNAREGLSNEIIQENFGLWTTMDSNTEPPSSKTLPDYPFLNIDAGLGSMLGFESLPLGYQALRFTDIPASAVLIEAYPGPTATDETIIERTIYERAKDLPLTQCLEMILVDSTSVRVIATVRYLQEYRLFVVSTLVPNYRVLPIDTSNITVQNIVVANRTNAFSDTDTSSWLPRASDFFSTRLRQLEPAYEEIEVSSNAAIAMSMLGGGMAGIGQAIGEAQNRKHQEKLQQNQFGQQTKMQESQFNQDAMMQGNMFGHETGMQTTQNDFLNMMQNGRFGQEDRMQYAQQTHEKDMQASGANETRTTNKMQSQNRMAERGLGMRSNFLNTSFATSV